MCNGSSDIIIDALWNVVHAIELVRSIRSPFCLLTDTQGDVHGFATISGLHFEWVLLLRRTNLEVGAAQGCKQIHLERICLGDTIWKQQLAWLVGLYRCLPSYGTGSYRDEAALWNTICL
jgi:hypothetical protein